MSKKEEKDKGITAKKHDDMSEWYQQCVMKAEMADYSPVKGFMVIRPYAYAIWENIQRYLDGRIKKHGVMNAYFPLLIPESFFKREAEHAKGFAPELAWIEKTTEDDRLAIRPTSETIMYDSYSRWVRSHRDLPLRINQWCNVLRWEVKQTKPFLRTREFLWQEGHCVYATEKDCDREVMLFLEEYRKMCEEVLAIPVISGIKTKKEKFAGAKYTSTVEALMPDGKALQMGTSHNLGQGFAQSFGISFLGVDEKRHTPWQTSWGVSTRLIGAVVMAHGDDKGLVLPPRIAPIQAVIVPIVFDKTKDKILKECNELKKKLKDFSVHLDDRDEYKPGWKFNEWEMKGVPLRIEMGPKDLEKKQVVLVRRDTGKKEFVKLKDVKDKVKDTLDTIQKDLFSKAKKFLKSSIVEVKSMKEMAKAVKDKKLAHANFCGEPECEDYIKEKTGGATSRCSPLGSKKPKGKCVHCGKQAEMEIYFSKSY